MSQENVEIVRRGWEHFMRTGMPPEGIIAPGFVWDMSTFREIMGLQPRYEGIDGVREFLSDWTEPFEDWQIEVESLHDAGDKVVAVCHQHARSKTSGLPVDMRLAMVFTLKDGLETHMHMYADPAEALKAVGLEE
jgi:ketosteroid isomerase-like protein